MADDKPGKMDIKDHQKMYNAFWDWSIKVTLIIAIILVLMYIFLT
jgi:hypothetical protein